MAARLGAEDQHSSVPLFGDQHVAAQSGGVELADDLVARDLGLWSATPGCVHCRDVDDPLETYSQHPLHGLTAT